MSYLSQIGTISYNGYTLQGPRNSVQCEITPVRDSSGRYITHSIYRYTIDAWITADTNGGSSVNGNDAATHLQTLQAAFEKDGEALTISGHGYGDITVNANSTQRDVAWGPKTRFLKLRNVNHGCIIMMWVVEVAVKKCQNGVISSVIGRLKEYVYTVSWSIKPNGCTIRTVQGHIEIFMATATVGGSILSQTADSYRNLIDVQIPKGFIRTQPQEYELSENKQRLRFKVIDEEQESDNAYPPGVSAIEVDHNVTMDLLPGEGRTGGSAIHLCSISGYVETAKMYPVVLGWSRVLLLIQERIKHAFNSGGNPIITFISITEAIFRRRVTFAVRYYILNDIPKSQPNQTAIAKMVTTPGLFTKITSTNDANYQQSMQLAWSNRGSARLIHNPSSDRLIDLCDGSGDQNIHILDSIAPYFFGGSTAALYLKCPTNYKKWENHIDAVGTSTAINMQQMPEGKKTPESLSSIVFTPVNQPQPGIGFQRKRNQDIQSAGSGSLAIKIIVRGRASRIGLPVEPPKLLTVMGANAGYIQQESKQTTTVLGYVNGNCPIHAMNWYYVYNVQFDSVSQMNAALAGANGIQGAVFDTPTNTNIK